MSDVWHVRDDSQIRGPFSAAQVQQLIIRGMVTGSTIVRCGVENPWVRADSIPGLLSNGETPLATPPVPAKPAPMPARTPTAVPIGSPVVSPAAARPAPVPQGTPVAAQPRPASIPVGTSVAPSPASPPPGPQSQVSMARSRRKSNDLWMKFCLAGLTAIVGVGGILGTIAGLQSGSGDVAEDTPDETVASADEPSTEQAKMTSSPDELAGQVRKWSNADHASVKVGGVQVRVSHVWASPHPNGKTDPSGKRAFLFTRLELTNTDATTSKDYSSWNLDVEGEPALLDSAGEVCHFANSRVAPVVGRLSPRSIGPGQKVTELLAFSLASSKSGTYRLVLPASVFGLNAVLGFEIPPEMVKSGPEETQPVAKTPDVVTRDPTKPLQPAPEGVLTGIGGSGAGPATEDSGVGESVIPETRPDTTFPSDPNQEPNIDDLRKSISDGLKGSAQPPAQDPPNTDE